VLRELFEGAGVASALDHTRIEAANDPEALQRDAAAARVARRAADALRRSRAACEVRAGLHGTAAPGPVAQQSSAVVLPGRSYLRSCLSSREGRKAHV
jgi:DNA excision repair protein ERCC-6